MSLIRWTISIYPMLSPGVTHPFSSFMVYVQTTHRLSCKYLEKHVFYFLLLFLLYLNQ